MIYGARVVIFGPTMLRTSLTTFPPTNPRVMGIVSICIRGWNINGMITVAILPIHGACIVSHGISIVKRGIRWKPARISPASTKIPVTTMKHHVDDNLGRLERVKKSLYSSKVLVNDQKSNHRDETCCRRFHRFAEVPPLPRPRTKQQVTRWQPISRSYPTKPHHYDRQRHEVWGTAPIVHLT